MTWILTLIIVLLIIVIIAAAAIVIPMFLLCLLSGLLDLSNRPGIIRRMQDFPEGKIFEAHSKGAEEAFSKIEPVFKFMEDPDSSELPVRCGRELADRVKSSKQVLKNHHIHRQIRFLDLTMSQQHNGSNSRKWNDGGKEWQAYELSGEMLETCTDGGGNALTAPVYYPTASVVFTMSRRLKEEELKTAHLKDKWGRKINGSRYFYQDQELKNCPSCGALLPQDLKDVVCPYCGSTIFSDYYDWQPESIEIEPQGTFKSLTDMFKNSRPAQKVIRRIRKGKKKKIVRFSENDFRKDVLESCRAESDADKLIDLYLGTLKIRSVKNTETQTFLKISVPVYKSAISDSGNIVSSRETMRAEFVRTRYPDRFNKKTAVISAEKQCPNCGGPFSPDEKGNCVYCGTFLYRDNLKWIRK